MILEDASAVRRYAESVLSNSRSAARYIERYFITHPDHALSASLKVTCKCLSWRYEGKVCHDRARTEILQQKRLYNITTSQDLKTISATCEGSHPEDRYKLQITLEGAEPAIECTCPAKEKEALCKHSLGLLLWRAGNLTEERLKRQIEGVGDPQQHLTDVDKISPAPGQHGAGQAQASEQATVAYQAAEMPTPPPVARTAAPGGKRRLPASFVKRLDQPAAKKGAAAGKKDTPVKPVTTVAAGPAQSGGKGQVSPLHT